jgi:hypothetical protein
MASKDKRKLDEGSRYNPLTIITPVELDALLSNESDRGIILIATAYLEELLGTVIAAACISTELADSLLRVRAPAGDFEARLLIAQAFGLVHADEVRCLRVFQKIRNKAAHFDRSGRGFDVLFDTNATADQVVELANSLGYKLQDRQIETVRVAFTNIARHLAITLVIRHTSVQRPITPKSEREVAEDTIKSYQNSPYEPLIRDITALEVAEPVKVAFLRSLRLGIDKVLESSVSQEVVINSFRAQIVAMAAQSPSGPADS